ncbi:PI-PLC domain-containing protein [Streptomyces sp. NPDC002838]|uniref:PI-PLC domain-containing protein n=1 Tax=Streptomyces sp. NPDC002838 TaxID=3154436 RepID=UPI00332B0411
MRGLWCGARWLHPTAWVVAVLCLAVLAAAATVRSTVLNAGFYGKVLEEERVYERFYDEVLVAPQSAALTRDLLARLAVPEPAVTSNLRIVLPPETLRAMANQQIAEVIAYLEGDRDSLRLTVDVRPLAENVGRLAQTYFGDAIASIQQRSEPDFQAFADRLEQTAARLVAGERPEGLPSLALSPGQAERAATMLLSLVPTADRQELEPEVRTALASGDVASALAVIAPAAVSQRTRAAAAAVLREAGGSTWVITTDLQASDDVLAPLDRTRHATRLLQEVVEPLAAGVGLAALALVWFSGPPGVARRSMALGWAFAMAGLLSALAAALVGFTASGSPADTPSSWPPAAARLIDDVQSTAFERVLTTATSVATLLLAVGALVVIVSWARQTRPVLPSFAGPRHRQVLLAAVAAAVTVSVVPAARTVPQSAPRICQGSPRLCEMPYDAVAHLTSHNAMATTAQQFIGPAQDPDITGQLNAGVRALQIDTHHWEEPQEIADRLNTSDFPPRLREQLTRALEQVNPPREGLWLCHSVCGAGAVELVPTLREIGDWLRTHPTEIVTLIVQDGISPEETERAFEQAGLADLLYEPGSDPTRQWPQLGDMIDSGRRLVVFAEKADGPAPWYRNFYRYGMETPFAFNSPQEMACRPNRGGADGQLFLLNHFVAVGGSSRLDAGRVNSRERVLDRVHTCERQRGSPVTFIAVDYATVGDPRGAVDALNTARSERQR